MRTSPFFFLFLGIAFTLGLALLAVELWHLQVLDVAEFKEDQRKQMVRSVLIPGKRGRILDRAGRVLADSRPSRVIVCRPERFPRKGGKGTNLVASIDAAIGNLSRVLDLPRPVTLTPARLARHLREASALPIDVWRDLSDEKLARFSVHAADFPQFDEIVRAERIYPYGTFAAHLLGYVGHDRPADDPAAPVHYWEPELKGRSGLEAYYDAYLAGATGERQIRVDARGFKPQRAGAATDRLVRAPADGLDLHLTIDAPLQHALERQLQGVAGAGVVLDPRTGAVLAMASAPAYNPNDFVPVFTFKKYRALSDDPALPLLNRAVAGTYAPGSTFKTVTALAALDAGLPVEEPYVCSGVFRLGGAFRLHCWNRYGHGALSLHRALCESCNTYFCQLGRQMGTNALIRTARAFGLGAKTGIDLGAEAAGLVPDDEQKRVRTSLPWYPGDTCQMAIGQGMLLTTPLQMAVVCAALANGGSVYRPYLRVREAGQPAPEPVRRIGMRAEDFARVRAGMRAVAEEGTGKRVWIRYGEGRVKYRLKTTCAAKTGTAEVGRGETRRKNVWVIAFAPYDHPTHAVALMVERGESGGLTAAPRVHNVLASVFGEELL